MKKILTLGILLTLSQFVVSQNVENRGSEKDTKLSVDQNKESPFRGKMNRTEIKKEGADFESEKLQERKKFTRNRQDSEAFSTKKMNQNISDGNRSEKKRESRDGSIVRDTTSIRTGNTGLKLKSNRSSVKRQSE